MIRSGMGSQWSLASTRVMLSNFPVREVSRAALFHDAATKHSRQLLQSKQNNALRVVANGDGQFSATTVTLKQIFLG